MRASDRAVHKQSKCSDPFWFCFFYFIWLDLYHLFPYENSIIFNPEKEVLTAIYFHFDFAEDSKVMISISQSSHVFYSTLNSEGRPKFWSSSSELLSHQLFLKILSPNVFFFFSFSHSATSFPIAAWLCLVNASFPYISLGIIFTICLWLFFSWKMLSPEPTPTPPLLVHACCLFPSPSSTPLSVHVSQDWGRLFSTVSWDAFS